MLKHVLSSILLLLALVSSSSSEDKVRITGEYSYTYGDSESLADAKNISYGMAVRNAIESYKTFVIATSTVNDYKLIKDIIQTISSGYVDDLRIVEQKINDRTIYTKIQGYIVPDVIERVLSREVKKYEDKEPAGLDDNGYIRILNVKRVRDGQKDAVEVIVKIVDIASSLFYDANKYKVCIDFYDAKGEPAGGDCGSIMGDVAKMIQGQITTIRFDTIPKVTASYKTWLLK